MRMQALNPSQQNVWRSLLPWLMWMLAALGVPYQFLLQSSTSVMIDSLQHSLAMTPAQVGFLSSSFFYTYLLLQIPAGLLVDRYGARLVLSVGVFICSIACFGFAHASTAYMAIFTRMLMGLAMAPAVSAGMAVAAKWFPPKRFAIVAGMTEMIGMTGGGLGEIYLAKMIQHLGWRQTLNYCFVAGLVLTIVMALFIKNQPGQRAEQKPNPEPLAQQLRCVLKLPQVWLNGLYVGFMFAPMPIFAGMWAVPYLQSRYGISLESAAVGSALMFFGSAMGSPFWGWLSDKICRRRLTMIVAAITSLSVLLLFMELTLTRSVAYFMIWLSGFCAGGYILAFATTKDQTPSCARATAMAYINMMSMLLGAWLLEPSVGVILQGLEPHHLQAGFSAHAYGIALFMMPICAGAALLTTLFIKETGCVEQC